MDEDIDIYADLDDYGGDVIPEKVKEHENYKKKDILSMRFVIFQNIQQIEQLELVINTLQTQLDEALNQKADLEFRYKQLEENMSTLLLTAKCEIDRKNDAISQLRKVRLI